MMLPGFMGLSMKPDKLTAGAQTFSAPNLGKKPKTGAQIENELRGNASQDLLGADASAADFSSIFQSLFSGIKIG